MIGGNSQCMHRHSRVPVVIHCYESTAGQLSVSKRDVEKPGMRQSITDEDMKKIVMAVPSAEIPPVLVSMHASSTVQFVQLHGFYRRITT